jgi:pimeloyl-ACP methyl ester carboxylesterase
MSRIRVLCLHGYHGSGPILREQMKPLAEDLEETVEFVYVDAPSLSTGDFGWWHHEFRGWERTRDWMADLFAQQRYFDGAFGFSQGAAVVSLLVGMRGSDGQAGGRKPISFEFAMMVGGFRSDSSKHANLYASRESYTLPSLHIMGRSDSIVPIEDSRDLSDHFTSPVVLEHSGGHVIPGTPSIRNNVALFLSRMAGRRSFRGNRPSALLHPTEKDCRK